ncbi:hypothetical protein EON63_11990, partial [archaeon]
MKKREMLSSQVLPSGTPNQTPSTILLLGPKQSYKSSIAFRLAYEDAYKGGNPLYVCARSKLTSPPLEVCPPPTPT